MVLRKPNSNDLDEEQRRLQIERNKPLIALLDSWLEDDSESPEEQRVALEELMRGIDVGRAEGTKLLANELRDMKRPV